VPEEERGSSWLSPRVLGGEARAMHVCCGLRRVHTRLVEPVVLRCRRIGAPVAAEGEERLCRAQRPCARLRAALHGARPLGQGLGRLLGNLLSHLLHLRRVPQVVSQGWRGAWAVCGREWSHHFLDGPLEHTRTLLLNGLRAELHDGRRRRHRRSAHHSTRGHGRRVHKTLAPVAEARCM